MLSKEQKIFEDYQLKVIGICNDLNMDKHDRLSLLCKLRDKARNELSFRQVHNLFNDSIFNCLTCKEEGMLYNESEVNHA